MSKTKKHSSPQKALYWGILILQLIALSKALSFDDLKQLFTTPLIYKTVAPPRQKRLRNQLDSINKSPDNLDNFEPLKDESLGADLINGPLFNRHYILSGKSASLCILCFFCRKWKEI